MLFLKSILSAIDRFCVRFGMKSFFSMQLLLFFIGRIQYKKIVLPFVQTLTYCYRVLTGFKEIFCFSFVCVRRGIETHERRLCCVNCQS